jgi:hypothetical protein
MKKTTLNLRRLKRAVKNNRPVTFRYRAIRSEKNQPFQKPVVKPTKVDSDILMVTGINLKRVEENTFVNLATRNYRIERIIGEVTVL